MRPAKRMRKDPEQNSINENKWRQENPELHAIRNVVYATKSRQKRLLYLKFFTDKHFDPSLFH
jgi:hypothetical protein